MKYKLILILLICWNWGNCQFFEGELKYEVNFQFSSSLFEELGISEDEIISKLKDDNEYFEEITILIKNENYVKEIHSLNPKKLVYLGSINSLYTFEKNSEFVPIIDTLYLPPKLGPVVKFDFLTKLELNYEKATSKIHKGIQA